MQQAARASDWTGLFWLGEIIEYNDTATMFTAPQDPKTEAYLTGRVG
jgi:phosphate transport system ATP-binding protein